MPLAGTGPILGAALKAAVDGVAASAVASKREVDRSEMFRVMGEAIVAHILANGNAVLGTSAPGGGPVVSVIT